MRTGTKSVAILGVLAVTATALVVFRAPATKDSLGLESIRVTRGDLGSAVKATGVVKPMVGAEVRVGSRASGVVDRLFVRVGDVVAAGQLLARLDTRELEARRDERRAALASARADHAWARADRARKFRLAEEGLVPPSDLDLAERAFAVAETREAEARAALASTELQLGYATIRAPADGVVADVATQEGETVAASFAAPTFVTLLDVSRLELRAYVDETDIGRVRPGQGVTFSVDTYPGVEFPGSVSTVYPKAEIRDNVVNYVAIVGFAPPAGRTLRPEMTATVRIAVETRKGVLTLPRRGVRRDGSRTYVLVPGAAGAPVRRWIETGAGNETSWEVRDGLREGDEVLAGEVSDKEEEG
jgi:macrolide-specific efflux system membrane fusion protein